MIKLYIKWPILCTEDDEDWSELLKFDENTPSIPTNLLYRIAPNEDIDEDEEDLIVVVT